MAVARTRSKLFSALVTSDGNWPRTAGNPLVPTFGDALNRSLSQQEAAEFTSYLRPLVETGAGLERRAAAYLTRSQGVAGTPRRLCVSGRPSRVDGHVQGAGMDLQGEAAAGTDARCRA
jgi:hypothetical protein